MKPNYLATASFKALPTLNLATVVAGTSTVLSVPGTLAVLASLFFTENVPNPTIATCSPFAKVSWIESMIYSSAAVVSFFVNPDLAAAISINCVLFIGLSFLIYFFFTDLCAYFSIYTVCICDGGESSAYRNMHYILFVIQVHKPFSNKCRFCLTIK